jgi:tetratricopeptide (TPR) repeat protein
MGTAQSLEAMAVESLWSRYRGAIYEKCYLAFVLVVLGLMLAFPPWLVEFKDGTTQFIGYFYLGDGPPVSPFEHVASVCPSFFWIYIEWTAFIVLFIYIHGKCSDWLTPDVNPSSNLARTSPILSTPVFKIAPPAPAPAPLAVPPPLAPLPAVPAPFEFEAELARITERIETGEIDYVQGIAFYTALSAQSLTGPQWRRCLEKIQWLDPDDEHTLPAVERTLALRPDFAPALEWKEKIMERRKDTTKEKQPSLFNLDPELKPRQARLFPVVDDKEEDCKEDDDKEEYGDDQEDDEQEDDGEDEEDESEDDPDDEEDEEDEEEGDPDEECDDESDEDQEAEPDDDGAIKGAIEDETKAGAVEEAPPHRALEDDDSEYVEAMRQLRAIFWAARDGAVTPGEVPAKCKELIRTNLLSEPTVLLIGALTLFYEGQYEQAFTNLNRSLKRRPSALGCAIRAVYWLQVRKDPGRANADLNCACSLDPQDAHAWLFRAEATENHAEAAEYADYAISLDPDLLKAYLVRGDRNLKAGRYENALGSLDIYLAKRPKSVYAWLCRGQANLSLGKYRQARTDFDTAQSCQAETNMLSVSKRAEIALGQGQALLALGFYPESVQSFEEAIVLNSQYAQAYLGQGQALAGLNNQERALINYNLALSINPHYAEAFLCRGTLHLKQKKPESALEDLNRAVEFGIRTAEAYTARGRAFQLLNQYALAISDFSRAIQTGPGRAEAYACLAQAHYDRVKPKIKKEIILGCDRSCNLIYNHDTISRRHARIYRQGERIMIEDLGSNHGTYVQSALTDHGNGAAPIPPGQPAALAPDSTVSLGKLKINLSQMADFGFIQFGKNCEVQTDAYAAMENFAHALQLEPSNYHWRLESGKCSLDFGSIRPAIQEFSQALETKSDFEEAFYYRGLAHEQLGEYDLAQQDFARAPNLRTKPAPPAEAPKPALNRKDGFSLPGRAELEKFFREQVIEVIANAEQYQRFGIGFPPPFALYGPPGGGKTFAVNALVDYLGWPSFTISSETVGSIYIHETSKKIAEIFAEARKKTPAVVVIDEMDAFLATRDNLNQYRVEEVSECLREIQTAQKDRILVIGMTNRIEAIDPAVLRRGRFDHKLEVSMASPPEIKAVLEHLLAQLPIQPGLHLEHFVHALSEHPLSDVAFLVREAGRLAARSGKGQIDDFTLGQALKESGMSNKKERGRQ